ncbi:Uncharacterised protein [uncultured archaeon]|nr:Uncharacterised protein [uncultured archaeon]
MMLKDFVKAQTVKYSQNSITKSIILSLAAAILFTALLYLVNVSGIQETSFSLDLMIVLAVSVCIVFPLLFSVILFYSLKQSTVTSSFQNIYSLASCFALVLGLLPAFHFLAPIGIYLITVIGILAFVVFLSFEYALSISFKGTNKIAFPFSLSTIFSLLCFAVLLYFLGFFSLNSTSHNLSFTFSGQKYSTNVFVLTLPNSWSLSYDSNSSYFVFEKGQEKLFGSYVSGFSQTALTSQLVNTCSVAALNTLFNDKYSGKITDARYTSLNSMSACVSSFKTFTSSVQVLYGVCPKGFVSLILVAPSGYDSSSDFNELLSKIDCTA